MPRGISRTTGHSINWKGGRSITDAGYVLIYVGKSHHLADVRGYAYEHRLALEAKLGRRLLPTEDVHHRDENRQNNDPANLEAKTKPWHRVEHRKPRAHALRMPDEPNPLIACECGCGSEFEKFDSTGRPRRFVSGHNPQVPNTQDAVLAAIRAGGFDIAALASREGKTTGAIRQALSELRKAGKIVGRGPLSRIAGEMSVDRWDGEPGVNLKRTKGK